MRNERSCWKRIYFIIGTTERCFLWAESSLQVPNAQKPDRLEENTEPLVTVAGQAVEHFGRN